MIQLQVRRDTYTDNSTIGELSVNGEFTAYTLEPRKDQSQGKPYCIPSGAYKVEILPSNHFGFDTPHVLDVPGFTAIEIHPGNVPSNTEGCTVVGASRGLDFVGNSDATFASLMRVLTAANDPDIQIFYLG